MGKKFDGPIRHNGGRAVDITADSIEEHILADGKEDRLSNADVLDAINDFQEKKVKGLLGSNVVTCALKRTNAKMVAVNKQKHSSNDPESDRLGSGKVQLCKTAIDPHR